MAIIIDEGGPEIWLNPNIGVCEMPPALPLNIFSRVNNPLELRPYVMKAQVRNNSNTPDAGVAHFYWANPTTYVGTVASAHKVGVPAGSSLPGFNIGAAGTRVVSSGLTAPFKPPYVNGGHICMFVAITPTASNPPSLDPYLLRVAQLNLNLVPKKKSGLMMFNVGFEVGFPDEDELDKFTLEVVQAPVEQFQEIVRLFVPDLPLEGFDGGINQLGVVDYRPCVDDEVLGQGVPMLDGLNAEEHTGRGLTVAGILEGQAALIHVIQRRSNGDILGGISTIVYGVDE